MSEPAAQAWLEVHCPRCAGLMVPERSLPLERAFCPRCGPGKLSGNVLYLPRRIDPSDPASLACANCGTRFSTGDQIHTCSKCSTRHVIPSGALPPEVAARLRDPELRAALSGRTERRKNGVLWVFCVLVAALVLLMGYGIASR
jgi:hypothetical protein